MRPTICVLAALLTLVTASGCHDAAREGLERALVGRGKLIVLGDGERPAGGLLVESSTLPDVAAALAHDDENTLAQQLGQHAAHGVLITGALPAAANSGIARRFASLQHVVGWTGVFLAPGIALYELDPLRAWSPQLRTGLAEVARKLVAGAAEPRMSSFPELVRRVEPVEVMVLLREAGRARLWRSARGSSFARALLTAADVARKRWLERQQAMGGSLEQMLPRLDVEVSLLQDDGELGVRDAAFVDRAVTAQHGVAYEYKGAWRYFLPESTHKLGAPSVAYAELIKEDGLPESSLRNAELRLYRLAVASVGVSVAPPLPHDSISPPSNPGEVLGE